MNRVTGHSECHGPFAVTSLRYEVLNEGKEVDIPVPMKYMSRYQWQRELRPSHHTTVLTALLHCRMREGYHIAGAHNGVITLVVPLRVQVSSTVL